MGQCSGAPCPSADRAYCDRHIVSRARYLCVQHRAPDHHKEHCLMTDDAYKLQLSMYRLSCMAQARARSSPASLR